MNLAPILRRVNRSVNTNTNKQLADSASQIGHRLRAARELAGLTQEQVAAELGVHSVTVSRWESQGVNARSDTLVRLAKLYGRNVDSLISGERGEGIGGEELSTDVSRGTDAKTRHARNLPLAVREYLAALRLRLTKGGASDDEIEEAMDLLRSPALFTFYKGGAPSEFNEQDVLRGMKAIAEGVVIPELRDRGRKIK